ncbi:TIR domain-containing protein [Cellulosilyticum lentocellum]|uniref:TIR protein n=1 Tax=Cellulosilyticum lentocellum (strain ATCC 49066 / DSM 5427 / NCIMB 11756 / RHM5) TaxID=642492 RepID=F2JHI2_CELLD|nr:TIR domain-containing protein [Cellulosilyticum lentocellum]ADZ84221.1 TIR protein [Cellulosilyticum lentocellum DSM 5427]
MQDVFISYSSKNKIEANKVCEQLEKRGISCWMAPRNIQPGKEWGEQIIRGIETSRVLVLIFSAASNESPQVLREVERAVSKRLKIINFRIENVSPSDSMEYFLSANHWLNAFDGNRETHIESLSITIKGLLEEQLLPQQAHPIVSKGLGKHTVYKKGLKFLAVGLIGIILIIIAYNLNAIRVAMVKEPQVEALVEKQQDKALKTPTAHVQASNQPLETPLGEVQVTPAPVETLVPTEKNNEQGNTQNQIAMVTQEPDNQEKVTPTTQAEPVQSLDIEIGSKVTFGVYHNEPIEWLVIHKDSKGNPLLLSEKILTLKAFDGAESGNYNKASNGTIFDGKKEKEAPGQNYTKEELRQMKGSNDWANSNLRTWLNSGGKTVSYKGQGPAANAFLDGANAYDKTYGFLYEFTKEEQALIQTTSYKNILGTLEQGRKAGGKELFHFERVSIEDCLLNSSKAYYETLSDKVFLLSLEEVEGYLYTQGIPIKTNPTEEAIEKDQSGWYKDIKSQTGGYHMWWLRTPAGESSSLVCTVGPSGEVIYTEYAAQAGVGIRPALYLEASHCTLEDGKIIKAK